MGFDVVLRLYACIEALEAVHTMLPEKEGGLAHLLSLLGTDLRKCTEWLDNQDKLRN